MPTTGDTRRRRPGRKPLSRSSIASPRDAPRRENDHTPIAQAHTIHQGLNVNSGAIARGMMAAGTMGTKDECRTRGTVLLESFRRTKTKAYDHEDV
jgi:hypothetical protein